MNLKAQYTIILIATFIGHYSVLAQRQVIGRVLDKDTKKPIKEAKVSIQGTDSSTVTNVLGYFQVTADTTTYLLISSEGYVSGKIQVPQTDKFLLYLTKNEVPAYPGDISEFYRFFQRNLRYPDPARRGNNQGEVYVSFEIDSLGKMQHLTLLKDIGGGCGDEVLRVLQACSYQWMSSSSISRFILPVTFRLAETFKRGTLEHQKVDKKVDLPAGTLMSEIVVTAQSFR